MSRADGPDNKIKRGVASIIIVAVSFSPPGNGGCDPRGVASTNIVAVG